MARIRRFQVFSEKDEQKNLASLVSGVKIQPARCLIGKVWSLAMYLATQAALQAFAPLGIQHMGYETHSNAPQGGAERDEPDQAQLRHGRDRWLGFSVGRYLQPAPMLFTRDGHNVFLGDTFRGSSAFLICGGPSLKTQDLSKLQQRGILTCAVNNAATIIQPNLWVSVDDPGNFSDSIWRDPAIWKFVPLCHMEKPFTIRSENGELVPSRELVGDMPGVFGYRRNEAFVAEQWLHEDTFNWGNHTDRVDAYGLKGSRSVMLVALRLLFYLGVRRLYLLGCDFRMTFGAQNYAFEQDRSRSSVAGNNGTYEALNVRLAQLRPLFEAEGFEVLNCTPDSGLKAFPYLDYEQAVMETLANFPKQISTAGMYDRKANEKARKKLPQGVSPSASPTEEPTHFTDPVESLNLPALTLVTAVDQASLETFRWTWRTWMLHRGWLRQMPALIIYNRSENLVDKLRQIVGSHEQVKLIGDHPDDPRLGRDRWTRAYLHVPARHVRTPWYLRLEPQTIASHTARWLEPEWFSSSGAETQPTTAFVSHAWGYTKPAGVFDILDAWAEGIEGLAKHPPLRLPKAADESRVKHDAISSWIFLGNTAWTQEISSYVPERLPCPSHDTFTLYCALRRKDRFVRWKMKDLGWEHSFAGPEAIIERCQNLLTVNRGPIASTSPDSVAHPHQAQTTETPHS